MAEIGESENTKRFIKVCEKHDVVEFLGLIKSTKNLKDVNFQSCFDTACENESNKKDEFIDLILATKIFKKNINISNTCSNLICVDNLILFKKLNKLISINEYPLSEYLILSIEYSNAEFFEYLIKKHKVEILVLNKCLIKSCELGKLEIIKFLFAHYDVDIHFDNDLAIRRAGSHNHLEIVKYLLEDENLKEKANPSLMNDDLSITAIMQENKELINYLYNDYGMKESQTVKDYKKYKEELANSYL